MTLKTKLDDWQKADSNCCSLGVPSNMVAILYGHTFSEWFPCPIYEGKLKEMQIFYWVLEICHLGEAIISTGNGRHGSWETESLSNLTANILGMIRPQQHSYFELRFLFRQVTHLHGCWHFHHRFVILLPTQPAHCNFQYSIEHNQYNELNNIKQLKILYNYH